MSFRNIIIESPAHVSIKNRQLVVRTDDIHEIAAEDITSLLLESRQSTISSAALSFLGQSGCVVFVCDEKHIPCAVLLPFCQHSRQLSVLKLQLNTTLPLKKRLWKSIIIAKIKNQSSCLKMAGKEAAGKHLESLAGRVNSGDTENVESTAAAFYFAQLFGKGFTRSLEGGINSALNYGYAILRGSVARSLALYGFIPAIGIHHHSELNSFNLADDFIEPFRPFVDILVVSSLSDEAILSPQVKRMLFNILNLEARSGGKKFSVSYSCERLAQSLVRSLDNKKDELILPELVDLKQHTYE